MTRYLHGHAAPVVAAHAARTIDNSAGYLAPHLRPGMRVLDVGCGPGSITLELAQRVAPGEVTGVDASESVVVQARAAAQAAGDEVTIFETADAMRLPYADDSFDIVHAHQVLQHVPDPVGLLREMARVTRPGGLVAARDADYEAMTWAPAQPGLTRWLALYRSAARGAGGESLMPGGICCAGRTRPVCLMSPHPRRCGASPTTRPGSGGAGSGSGGRWSPVFTTR